MFTKIISNQKGFILITSYMVVAVLLILSSAYLMYALTENRASQREKWAQEAFYAAEEGIAYAVAESRQWDYQWFTHNSAVVGDVDITQHATNRLGLVPIPIYDGTHNGETGLYRIPGRNFLVKTYPDLLFQGVTVIRSVGQISVGPAIVAQRAIEYRITSPSMFQYFMFFAQSQSLGSPRGTIYDAGGLGSIHVNGNINLYGPDFRNLTALNCSGYFKTPRSWAPYADPAYYDKIYWNEKTKSYKYHPAPGEPGYDGKYDDRKAEWLRETSPDESNYANYDYTRSPFWNIDDYFHVDYALDWDNNIRAKINGLNIPITLGDGYSDAYYDWKMYAGGDNTVTFEVTPEVLSYFGVASVMELYNKINGERFTGTTNANDWLNADFEYGRGLDTFDDSKYVQVNYLDTEKAGQAKYWNAFLADPNNDGNSLDALTEVVGDANADIRAIKTSTIDTKKKEDAKTDGVYIRDYNLDYDDWNNNFYLPYKTAHDDWFRTVYLPWYYDVYLPWRQTHPIGQRLTWDQWRQYWAMLATSPIYTGPESVSRRTLRNPIHACTRVKWLYNSVRPPMDNGTPKRTTVLEIDVVALTRWIAK